MFTHNHPSALGLYRGPFTLFEDDDCLFEPFPMSLSRHATPVVSNQSPTMKALARAAQPRFSLSFQDELRLVVNAPGVDPANIKLEFHDEDRLLEVSGCTKYEEDGVKIESTFNRSFTVPKDVDTAHLKARFEGDLLTVTAPRVKKEKKDGRVIDIQHSTEEKKLEKKLPEATAEHTDLHRGSLPLDLHQ